MSHIDLVTRCAIESSHTPIRLSVFDDERYDNTKFPQNLLTEIFRAKNLADQQCFSKYTFVENKIKL